VRCDGTKEARLQTEAAGAAWRASRSAVLGRLQATPGAWSDGAPANAAAELPAGVRAAARAGSGRRLGLGARLPGREHARRRGEAEHASVQLLL